VLIAAPVAKRKKFQLRFDDGYKSNKNTHTNQDATTRMSVTVSSLRVGCGVNDDDARKRIRRLIVLSCRHFGALRDALAARFGVPRDALRFRSDRQRRRRRLDACRRRTSWLQLRRRIVALSSAGEFNRNVAQRIASVADRQRIGGARHSDE
jgi:hypothetical protein